MVVAVREATVERTNQGSVMKMKPTIPMLAVLAVTVVVAGVASAVAFASGSGSTHSALVIRHELRGCHTWSVNGGAFKPSRTVTLSRGGWITVTNNDVMPHKLVKTSGPAVTITRLNVGMGMGLKGTFPPAMMAHMGAAAKVTFNKVGVYKFTTKAGEDYMSGIKTIGEDNVLKLKVIVS
jgi:plastocyanin